MTQGFVVYLGKLVFTCTRTVLTDFAETTLSLNLT